MEFPPLLKKVMEETYAAWESAKETSPEERKARFGRRIEVSAKYLDGLRKELESGGITWYSDALKSVGGRGEYPGALQHFLASLPLCQMSHYAERASVMGLRLDGLEMRVRGSFIAMQGHGFDAIEYETRITSPESPEGIKELVELAENDCYVTNTLKRCCRITGRIFLNGELLEERRHP